ncbi:hypothetical protein HHI36_023728 [Cryptolaemus montrouzieri]|uniref:Peptidase A2 domain-containing protein n=1 Tax=Cryptolaemus montrouzieri TaxID=559131 RepID=A0ABD2PHW5_9CUCU
MTSDSRKIISTDNSLTTCSSEISSFPVSDIPIPNAGTILSLKHNDNRPYLEIGIGSKDILGLIDTGSNISILGKPSLYLLSELNLNLQYDLSTQVHTADSKLQCCLGYVSLQNSTEFVKCFVIP